MEESKFNERLTDAAKTIFSYCMAKTSNKADAEDLSQDILLELMKSSKSIRDENAFYGFMWAVANNVYNHWYKRKLKNTTCELDENIPSDEDLFNIDENSDIYLLRRELTLLSEKYRKATVLYYVDKKSCQEIADILSITESMVKYLLFKSRKILKEGMNMERNLGELSYNPKLLIPMYHGEGPNQFDGFMSSKVRQNIVGACYNDSLTMQQISLETGIPLPYIDDDIKALTDKKILVRDGNKYKANVIIITSDCSREIDSSAALYHEKIAESIGDFIDKKVSDFRKIGFYGSDFSDRSIRWALATLVFRAINRYDFTQEYNEMPKTAWGERAYLYLTEKQIDTINPVFRYSGMGNKEGDSLMFFDYVPKLNGDHHDFYGNERYINIICDIARGRVDKFSEYDLEAVGEMIRLGYVAKKENEYKLSVLVYRQEQYNKACRIVNEYIEEELAPIIKELDKSAKAILTNHTPKHLQNQVPYIASRDKFLNGVCVPATVMVGKGSLSDNWIPTEMPTNFIILHN